MKTKTLHKFVLAGLCFFFILASALQAETSVYYCSETGAYGFCYGPSNTGTCAYDKCVEHGGKTPVRILYVAGKGYGAIYIGKNEDGGQVVGAAAGYATVEEACKRAKEECIRRGGLNVYLDQTFHE